GQRGGGRRRGARRRRSPRPRGAAGPTEAARAGEPRRLPALVRRRGDRAAAAARPGAAERGPVPRLLRLADPPALRPRPLLRSPRGGERSPDRNQCVDRRVGASRRRAIGPLQDRDRRKGRLGPRLRHGGDEAGDGRSVRDPRSERGTAGGLPPQPAGAGRIPAGRLRRHGRARGVDRPQEDGAARRRDGAAPRRPPAGLRRPIPGDRPGRGGRSGGPGRGHRGGRPTLPRGARKAQGAPRGAAAATRPAERAPATPGAARRAPGEAPGAAATPGGRGRQRRRNVGLPEL
ncbi:MAG: hypothetical protein AVDCRST_MAG19-2778, partial [uncultured Thermomicrobiales bacterium]